MTRASLLTRPLAVAAGLFLLWFVWHPPAKTLPGHLIPVDTPEAWLYLRSGDHFILEATAHPLSPGPSWQGRFAYLRKEKRDSSGGSGFSRHVQIVVTEDHRPSLRLETPGHYFTLPASGYALDHARQVKPSRWPRKWLWTTPVENWHPLSTGISPGETVSAIGLIDARGNPTITSILEFPFANAARRIGKADLARATLTYAGKIALSVFTLSFVIPWRSRRIPDGA